MTRDIVGNFVVGVGVGIAIGLLVAPAAGQKTRQAIKSKADEGKHYLKRRSIELRDNATQIFENTKGAVADTAEAGKQAYQSIGTQPKPPQGEIARTQSDQMAG